MSDSEHNENHEQEERGLGAISSPYSHSPSPSLDSLRQIRRLSQPNVPNQSLDYLEQKITDDELICILCNNVMKEVFATACGHSFCYECLDDHIKYRNSCPSCRSPLTRRAIYPNFQLNRLAELKKQVLENHVSMYRLGTDPLVTTIRSIKSDPYSISSSMADTFSYLDIQRLLEVTREVKKRMMLDDSKIKADLLDAFLVKLKSRNDMTIQNLRLQNRYILSDLDMLVNKQALRLAPPSSSEASSSNTFRPIRKRKFSDVTDVARRDGQQQSEDQSTEEAEGDSRALTRLRPHDDYEADICALDESFSSRIDKRFDDLKDLYYQRLSPHAVTDMNEDERQERLESFASTLHEITRFDSLSVKDTLQYTETVQNTSIVSSIEFDRDDEFFAVGGILKDIKIYDFKLTNQGFGDNRKTMHSPVRRINCENKISCLSWSSYIKSQIASSDYQGLINVWDVVTGQKMATFSEHQKRAWSVDTCPNNPNLLASGSDDTTVKVWSLNSSNSLFTLEHKGNICCAKFAPNNSNHLAVGSADHHVICYDLRYPTIPLHTYQGHQKAVSYVKWLNNNELVSASTDNSLKLWNKESTECLRTFRGHLNEKNFVGLSVSDDWIACGSETNVVYTYNKYSRTPVAHYNFPMDDINGNLASENDPTYFVSSVCWKKDKSRLISANSKGIIRILQLK